MKKLLLILTLPCLLSASDKPNLKETVREKANETIEVVSTGIGLGAAAKGILCGGAALYAGDFVTAGAELVEAAGIMGKCSMHRAVWLWVINPKPKPVLPEQTALDKAYEESAKRAEINEEIAGTVLRRCLSENANCTDLNSRGIPKRCNSPARDYAMINDVGADRVVANFVKWQKERRGSV